MLSKNVKIRPLMDGNHNLIWWDSFEYVKIRPLMDGNEEKEEGSKCYEPVKIRPLMDGNNRSLMVLNHW